MNELLIFEKLYSEFLFIFIRIVFFIAFAPVFSASQNLKLKIGVASTLTIMLMGIIPPGTLPNDGVQLAYFVLIESIIGISMAMVLKITFAITEIAGHAMSQAGGLSFAVTADPQNGAQIPVVGNFLSVIALLLFLSLDGIAFSLAAVANSFKDIYPGTLPSLSVIESVWKYSSTIFTTAFMIALPIVTAVTMANIAFGVMTRTAPQINILSIGLPISLSITLIMVLFGMEGFVYQMQQSLTDSLQFIYNMYGR